MRDIVKDSGTNNIFIVNTAHTSSGSLPLTTNTNSAKYDLIVDAATATTAQTAAASSASAASTSASTATTKASEAATSATNATSWSATIVEIAACTKMRNAAIGLRTFIKKVQEVFCSELAHMGGNMQ